MSPEALPHLDRAWRMLEQARGAAEDGSWDLVAYAGYTAASLAAQVLIWERGRQTAKTHNGLKSELNRYSRLEPAMDQTLVGDFGRAETTRHEATYGPVDTGEDAGRKVLTWAERFVAEVERVLALGEPGDDGATP